MVGILDRLAPSDYELPGFAEPLVRNLSSIALLSI
jgi:hypothetical protein